MARIGNTYRELAEYAAYELGEQSAIDGNLLDLDIEVIQYDVQDKIGFCPENAFLLNAYKDGFREGCKIRYFNWNWIGSN